MTRFAQALRAVSVTQRAVRIGTGQTDLMQGAETIGRFRQRRGAALTPQP